MRVTRRSALNVGFLIALVAVQSGRSGRATDKDEVPRLRVEFGNPWLPPFGPMRAGRNPIYTYVEFPAGKRPATSYVLVARRKGKEIGRIPLQVPKVPPYQVGFPSYEIRDDERPDQFVLLAETGVAGKPVEVARTAVTLPEIDVEAVARANTPINSVDLGAILVPADHLLLGPGQKPAIVVAAFSRARDVPAARLAVWFESAPGEKVDFGYPLAREQFELINVVSPPVPRLGDRDVLHIVLDEKDGKEFLHKKIPVMLVREPPKLPDFGATALKLRYDAPISVRDPGTGALSTLKYEDGWDPSLKDVVVSLPNGARFVFWRGSSYIPFWAGLYNTGLCYEWAENLSRPPGAVDCVEPLMDKELRYGRVEIVESTAARVHVRWSYQSTDLLYHVWGDSAVEDYYFYPDGFGTRVLNLKSDPASDYELSEFIILTPQEAYPLAVLPRGLVDILFLDGDKSVVSFPPIVKGLPGDRGVPAIYRIRLSHQEEMTAVYFNPNEPKLPPVLFAPFSDRGQMVTPAYWGSHWPLARGNATGNAIDDRIHFSPSHNSLLSWANVKPTPLRAAKVETLDALGHPRTMLVRRWAWLIGMTGADDERLLTWARSFAKPPTLAVRGARIDLDGYAQERRASRLVVESHDVSITLTPDSPCVNPVFELIAAPKGPVKITVGGQPLDPKQFAWDGQTLWLDSTFISRTELRFQFGDPP